LAKICIKEQAFSLSKETKQIELLLKLIKAVGEYNKATEASYAGFVSRFCTSEDVYSIRCRLV